MGNKFQKKSSHSSCQLSGAGKKHSLFRIVLIFSTLWGSLIINSIQAAETIESASEPINSQIGWDPGQEQVKFKVSVNAALVTTDVRVAGRQKSELLAEDFVIYDNKVSQEITHFSYDRLPIAVALLIDASGSVQSNFPLLQLASLLSLKNLKPEDQVALFSFNDYPVNFNDLTEDRLLIAQNISSLYARGGTNIYYALSETASYLHKKAPNRRRAIIMVSDNCHSGGAAYAEMKRARDDVLESSVSLYSIRTPAIKNFWEESCNESNNWVKETADLSGGELLEVDSSTSLQTALKRAITNIRYQYTLGFSPSDPGELGSYHALNVKLRAQDRCPECRVVTRQGYYSGGSPPITENIEVPQIPSVIIEETNELLIQRSILTAATIQYELPDIPFTIKAVDQTEVNGQPQYEIRLNIDPTGIEFNKTKDRPAFNLQIVGFYGDNDGNILGSDWKLLGQELSEEDYDKVMEEGILYKTDLPLMTKKQMIKFVVYDATSDRLGSKQVWIPFTVESVKRVENDRQLQLKINIDPAGIGFIEAEDHHTCNLRIAILNADDNGKILGGDWKRLKSVLSEKEFNKAIEKGIEFQTSVPIKAEDKQIKIIVYDEESDKINSRLVRLPE